MTNDTQVFCLYYTNVFLLIQKDNVDTDGGGTVRRLALCFAEKRK